MLLVSVAAPPAWPQTAVRGSVSQAEFRLAQEAFRAGRYGEAASRLEALKQKSPKSFDVNELLGLTYSAESETAKAVMQLRLAAALRPASAAAEVNLGTALLRAGQAAEARSVFDKALTLQPRDFDANASLATLLLQQDKVAEAKPYLLTAHQARPEDSRITYNLALASLVTGDFPAARTLTEALLTTSETAEAHNLLGRIDEQEKQFVQAANEFAAAARLDPSEENLYVWGGEMLQHRTYEPAVAIFRDATQRYPQSPRLWVGLGMALYSREKYSESVQALVHAASIDPHDPRSYVFLYKAYLSAPDQADEAALAFRRYAEIEPFNARAQFYYALALWKAHRTGSAAVEYPAIEALLTKSIQLDGNLAEAHLQLGILYSDLHQNEKALPEYQRAAQLDPTLAEAHFRLGRYFSGKGQKDKADAEFSEFKRLEAAYHAGIDKQRAEVQQFVVPPSGAQAEGHQQ